jgi:hypothetical protein
VESIPYEKRKLVERERPQPNTMQPDSFLFEVAKRAREGVSGIHFIVAIRPY